MNFGISYDKIIYNQNSFELLDSEVSICENGSRKLREQWKNKEVIVDSFTVDYVPFNVTGHWVEITNISSRDITINRIDTFTFHLSNFPYKILYFESGWGKEFSPVTLILKNDIILESRSGRSSEKIHPWFAVTDKNGRIYSASIAWSGNWIIRFEKEKNAFKVSGGLSDWEYNKVLKPGCKVMGINVITAEGRNNDLDSLAWEYNQWGRKYWYPTNSIKKQLPIEWNHWWPYEDEEINEEIFKSNVDAAADMGIEVCTLDAGWFGKSDGDNNWYDIRGDWTLVNTLRFPSGIRALSDYVHKKGMKFGLWCEIEALGKNAELKHQYPNFEALKEGKSLGYICLGNTEALEWAFKTLDTIINKYKCDWIKLDFNLSPGPGCNNTQHGHGDGDGLVEHYNAYYSLLDRIRKKHPHVVLENCSAGGLRIDFGIMKQTDNTFLSDVDLPILHLQHFWAATLMLAPETCLSWFWSQTRKNQRGKRPFTSLNLVEGDIKKYQLDYYIRISMLGWLGFSHKLSKIPDWIKERLKKHITFYKKHLKPFIINGRLYRLTGQVLLNGSGDRWSIFQYVMPDKGKSVVMIFRLPCGEKKRVIKLKGLDNSSFYLVSKWGKGELIRLDGRSLMNKGLSIYDIKEEESVILFLNKISDS